MTVKGDLNDYARTTNYTETAPNKPEHIVQELQGQQNGQSTLEFSHMMLHYYSTPMIHLCLPVSSNFSTARKPISCH